MVNFVLLRLCKITNVVIKQYIMSRIKHIMEMNNKTGGCSLRKWGKGQYILINPLPPHNFCIVLKNK